jgi:hypothetical protein
MTRTVRALIASGIAMNLILREVMGNSAIVVNHRASIATGRTTY